MRDDARVKPTADHAVPPTASAEVFVIPLTEPDRFLIYAPLRRSAFVGTHAIVNFIADLNVGKFERSADPDGSLVEFLRGLQIIDAGPEVLPITRFGGDPEPTVLTLFLTTACNLRCTYCYASAGDTPVSFMSLDVAKRGIDFVAGNAVRKGLASFDINYHGGGEPTVNWAVLTLSHAYARQVAGVHGLDVQAATATNGILTDSQIDWVVTNLRGASISFDGLPDVHDRHRPLLGGRGSSQRVMHTLRGFDAAGFSYGLRLTVTADQIPSLAESVEFICANFSPRRIQVEPAYLLGRWSEAPSAETDDFLGAFRAARARAHALGRDITYSAARLEAVTNHFCGVTQDSFCLSTDGNVTGCYEVFSTDSQFADKFFYGHPSEKDRGYTFDLPVLNNLRNQAVQHHGWCQGCFAKWNCAGDCYHKALTVNGDGEFRGSDRCHITRELTKDQILKKIADAGGVFWHESLEALPVVQAADKELL